MLNDCLSNVCHPIDILISFTNEPSSYEYCCKSFLLRVGKKYTSSDRSHNYIAMFGGLTPLKSCVP